MARIRLGFDAFGWDAMATTAEHYHLQIAEFLAAAGRRYIVGPPEERATAPWFLRCRSKATLYDVMIEVPDEELEALEHVARGEQLEVEALLHHAVIVLIADLDCGRLSEEVFNDSVASVGVASA